MGKKTEESSFLEKFLDGLIFFFIVLAILLRPFISGLRANLAGPVEMEFLKNLALTYGQEKSLHLFINSLLGFATVAFVLKNILKEHFRSIRTAIDLPLALLLLMGWASLFWASHLYSSLMMAVTWTSLVFFFYVVANMCADGWGEKIVLALIGVGVLLAVMAMIEVWYVYPQVQEKVQKQLKSVRYSFHAQRLRSRTMAGEASGPFITSNILGGFFALLFPVIFGMLLDCWERRKKAIFRMVGLGFALVTLGIGLALTGSKGAWMALIVGMTVFAILTFRRAIFRSYKKMLLALLIVVVSYSALLGGVWAIKGPQAWQKSIQVRMDYNRATWKLIKDHIFFGCGLNNFHSYYSAYKVPTADEMIHNSHNDYLEIWAELGILGLFFYLWMWFGFFKTARKDLALEPPKISKKSKKKKEKKKQSQKDKHFFSQEVIRSILLTLAGCVGLGFLYTFQSTLASDGKIFWILLGIWVGLSLLLTYPSSADLPSQKEYISSWHNYLRIGIFAGLSAFLFHGLGSFVLYSPGVFFAVLVLMAFLLGDHHQWVKEKQKAKYLISSTLSFARQMALFLFFFLLIGFLLFALRTNISSDRHIQKGDEFRQKIFQAKGALAKVRWLKKSLEEYSQAARLSPLDEKIPMAEAKVLEFIYRFEPKEEYLTKIEKAYQMAHYLAPRNFNISYHFSRFYLNHKTFPNQKPLDLLKKAQFHLESAVNHFPTNARYRFELGKVYLRLLKINPQGDLFQKAQREFRMALSLNRLVPRNYAIVNARGERDTKAIEDSQTELVELMADKKSRKK